MGASGKRPNKSAADIRKHESDRSNINGSSRSRKQYLLPSGKGLSKGARKTAPGSDEAQVRALKRMEMGPSDTSDSSDTGGEGDGVYGDLVKRKAAESSRGEEQFRARALERMEMGPSDDSSDQAESFHGSGDSNEDSDAESDETEELGRTGVGKQKQNQAGRESGIKRQRSDSDDDNDDDENADSDELNETDEGEDVRTLKGSGYHFEEKPKKGKGPGKPTAELQEKSGGAENRERNESDDDDDDDDDDVNASHSNADSTEEDEDEDEDEEAALLAEVPLGERVALKSIGAGPTGEAAREAAARAKQMEQHFKRPNKHRPHEMSSKRPVPRFREVVTTHKKSGRDPRFEPSLNPADKDVAAKRYAFVYDEMLPGDREQLKAKIKKATNPHAKAALSVQLQRLDQVMRGEQERRRMAKVESEWKSKERESLKAGGKSKPFFLKQSEKKRLALMERYKELKAKGQLDKYMEKRRRRNASKDHRYIPTGEK